MLKLDSQNPYLSELAIFIQETSPKTGLALTEKVTATLTDLSAHRSDYLADKFELAKMEWDARQIMAEINGFGDSILWSEQEKNEKMPEKLRQGLVSMINILTARTFATYSPFYHSNLLERGIKVLEEKENTNIRQNVREFAENLLKEAFDLDKQAHFLLRDPSSQTPPERGIDLFTLSFIRQDGTTFEHKLLAYYSGIGQWGENGSSDRYKDVSELIETIIPNAAGIKAETLNCVESTSYELN